MSYTCHYCERDCDSSAHTITKYDDEGVEERLEVLCNPCYTEWLYALKG
jgi:hypothetical protein